VFVQSDEYSLLRKLGLEQCQTLVGHLGVALGQPCSVLRGQRLRGDGSSGFGDLRPDLRAVELRQEDRGPATNTPPNDSRDIAMAMPPPSIFTVTS
jgi:hypothetical protein